MKTPHPQPLSRKGREEEIYNELKDLTTQRLKDFKKKRPHKSLSGIKQIWAKKGKPKWLNKKLENQKYKKDIRQSELNFQVQLNSLDWLYTEAQNTFMLN